MGFRVEGLGFRFEGLGFKSDLRMSCIKYGPNDVRMSWFQWGGAQESEEGCAYTVGDQQEAR